jgi:hypothetical protein
MFGLDATITQSRVPGFGLRPGPIRKMQRFAALHHRPPKIDTWEVFGNAPAIS